MPSIRASWGRKIAAGRRGPWLKFETVLVPLLLRNGAVFLIKMAIFNLVTEVLNFYTQAPG
jgi:hypothetical protein